MRGHQKTRFIEFFHQNEIYHFLIGSISINKNMKSYSLTRYDVAKLALPFSKMHFFLRQMLNIWIKKTRICTKNILRNMKIEGGYSRKPMSFLWDIISSVTFSMNVVMNLLTLWQYSTIFVSNTHRNFEYWSSDELYNSSTRSLNVSSNLLSNSDTFVFCSLLFKSFLTTVCFYKFFWALDKLPCDKYLFL